jgi:hypothetical protein
MSERDDKLKRLNMRETAKSLQVSLNGDAFLDLMDKVDELKAMLGDGIEITNIDKFIGELKEVGSLKTEFEQLTKAIDSFKLPEIPQMPDKVKLSGLSDLIKAVEQIPKEKVDLSSLTLLTDAVGSLIGKIDEITVPKQGQQPSDYMPMRRVVKVGEKLMYDDSFYTGGGGGGAAASSVSITGDSMIQGDVANGSVDSGNPVKIGGVASTSTTAAVTNGQRVNAEFSKTGKQVVIGALREQITNQQTTITSSTVETTIVTADATYFLDLYGLILTNTSATATKVTIKDATSGTTRMVFQVPATDTRGFMLPVDSGHKQATVNNNWTVTCGTSVASLEVTALVNKRL